MLRQYVSLQSIGMYCNFQAMYHKDKLSTYLYGPLPGSIDYKCNLEAVGQIELSKKGRLSFVDSEDEMV